MLKRLSAGDWNFTNAAHLLNRAGFGGTPQEIEQLVKIGFEKAVARLVNYETTADPSTPPDWARPGSDMMGRVARFREMNELMQSATTEEDRKVIAMEQREMFQAEQRKQRQYVVELRGWWLRRMIETPRPLQEKLTLFWHGHFATSVEKVRFAYLMYLQNETFRKHASGNWYTMLETVAKDPAMLIWLDQAQSRKEHPNENFARELMELFTLGEGNYTEKDVTEAARALTGFSFDRFNQTYMYRPFAHDSGQKTVLGHTGNLNGEDVLKIVAEHPQSARFICRKLWTFFVAENPSPQLVQALADLFVKNGRNFKPLLETIFSCREFYAPEVIRAQVKSPVQWLTSSVRMLERELPDPIICVMMLRQLGQELFQPPNVKGWDGGLSWITTNNLLSRYNLATTLVNAQMPVASMPQNPQFRFVEQRAREILRRMPVVDVSKLLTERERSDKTLLIPALEKRFLQAKLKEKQRKVLQDYLDSRGTLDDDDIRQAIRLVMATPEYQVT